MTKLHTMIRTIVLSCLLLSFGTLQAQDLNPVTLEFLVNQHIPGEQSLPHVASDEDGGYVIAWRSWGQDGSFGSIRARRYGADHQPLTDEILITTDLGSASTNRPFVHYWKEGRFVIRWTVSSEPGGYRVLNADNTLEDAQAISIGTDNDVDIRGDVMLTAYTSSQHIRLRKWDLLTQEWMGPYVQASEVPSNDYKFPQVRWTSTGGVVAVYKGGTPSPHRIYRKPFNGDLLAQTPEDFIHSTNGTMQVINVSINSQDQLLVYAQLFSNGLASFVGRIMDPQGNILVQGFGNMTANNATAFTECELFDNGNVVLTNNFRPTSGDPLDYCVRANYALNLGSPNTGFQFATTTTSGNQRYPSVAKLPNAGYVVAWAGNGFQGDDNGVYARAFAASDFPTAAPEREGLAFEAYPNPFHGQLFVTVDAATPLEVFDAAGRVVHGERLMPGTSSLELPGLLPGAYVLRWFAADGTPITHRVVKE
ncbi:MAG: T9SS type A sorting domain-containing protein [Flavobacteriales bacterium]|nr:T9SS type A sorting domain-containing protein [Flavobacteriales bacterium]